MNNKDFIKYEQALALKELGFDEPCFSLMTPNGTLESIEMEDWEKVSGTVLAPLKQQVFRWFREKYNIVSSIDYMKRTSYHSGYIVHFRGINGVKLNEENFIVLNDELPQEGYQVFESYKEAEDACIDKLIELVKEKQ